MELNAFFRDAEKASLEVVNAALNSPNRRHIQSKLTATPQGSMITLRSHSSSITLHKPSRDSHMEIKKRYQAEASLREVR